MVPASRPFRCRSSTRGRCIALAVAVLVLASLAGAAPCAAEPAPETAPVVHHLPFPAGTTYKVWQGNDQKPSHDDAWNRYAFDFSPMPEGSPVCATADGTVVYVKEDTAGPTGDWHDNNEVALLHVDGTVGTYLHLEQDGATVEVGDVVYAGDVIGRAGNTGNSRACHLHFGLRQGKRLGPSIPCRFAELPGDGVPKTGEVVTSRNVAGRGLHEALAALDGLYDDLAALDAREALADTLQVLPKRPPPAVDRALDALGRRADFVALWERRRAALLERHAREAAEAVTRLRAALETGDLVTAVYLADAGRREFAAREEQEAFRAAQRDLRDVDGAAEARKAARARLALRTQIVRAVERDLETREKAARGRRVSWRGVAPLYDRAVKTAEAAGEDEAARRLRGLAARGAAALSR